MTTLRVRKGATVGRPEARRSCFTEDLAAMPPTREASAALGMAMAAFIAKAFDGNEVNDEVRDAKSRVESGAASDEGCCAEKCAADVCACHLSIVGGSKTSFIFAHGNRAKIPTYATVASFRKIHATWPCEETAFSLKEILIGGFLSFFRTKNDESSSIFGRIDREGLDGEPPFASFLEPERLFPRSVRPWFSGSSRRDFPSDARFHSQHFSFARRQGSKLKT